MMLFNRLAVLMENGFSSYHTVTATIKFNEQLIIEQLSLTTIHCPIALLNEHNWAWSLAFGKSSPVIIHLSLPCFVFCQLVARGKSPRTTAAARMVRPLVVCVSEHQRTSRTSFTPPRVLSSLSRLAQRRRGTYLMWLCQPIYVLSIFGNGYYVTS